MYQSSTRLPHLAPPRWYYAPEHYQREINALFLPGWHLVATRDELANQGDFITCDLLGRPLQVRNSEGEIRAYSNICAHRHCLLTSQARGNSPRLRCQYHGWEYDRHGRTARIPEPKNFAPIDRAALRLPEHRVESCGQLVFVSLDSSAPPLIEALGPWGDECAERFGGGWRRHLSWAPEYAANWKVPIENSLEAYHVPSIHPRTFREDPGERRAEHTLGERSTSYRTQLPFSPHNRLDAWYQNFEARLLGWLGVESTRRYRQAHVFPNLLFSFTDTVSLCHAVVPTSPTTCRAVIRQFGRDDAHWAGWHRALAAVWGRLGAKITKTILLEDMALYADIQRGLSASPHVGVLGRCEERIHAFQRYLVDACESGHAPVDGPDVESPANLDSPTNGAPAAQAAESDQEAGTDQGGCCSDHCAADSMC